MCAHTRTEREREKETEIEPVPPSLTRTSLKLAAEIRKIPNPTAVWWRVKRSSTRIVWARIMGPNTSRTARLGSQQKSGKNLIDVFMIRARR